MRITTGLFVAIFVQFMPAIGMADRPASTVVGILKLHQLQSVILHTTRTLRVWLPPGYDAHPSIPYAVLYMHDGQNLFDKATSAYGHEWEVDETLTKLITNKTIPPLIVVGIDNGQAERLNEFTYAADPKHGGGNAAMYTKFLLEEVKPFIEKTYPVSTDASHNYLGGSSLGGLLSLEIARRHPGIFGGVMAMSPSIWWPTEPITDDITKDATVLAHTRIWIDMGTCEEDKKPMDNKTAADNKWLVDETRRLDGVLADHHVEHRIFIEENGHHNEIAWARRFPQAVRYLLNGK